MKKIAMLILVLSLMCGVLTGCGNGNISNRKDGMVTDSPNDAEDIIDRDDDGILDRDDDGMLDGDRDGMKNKDKNKDKNKQSANDGNKDKPVATSIPGESPDITQPVTP